MQWRARPGEPARDPQTTETRLFCFAHAGGGAAVFRNWQKALPVSVEVFGVVLPGREKRFQEPAVPRVGALVADLASAIAPFSDRKIALYGHSLGGLLAFEVARRLAERHHIQVAHLIVAGAVAPQFLPPANQLHKIEKDSEFIASLSDFGGMQSDVLAVPELLEMLIPVLRADIEAYETYSYVPGGSLEKMPWPLTVLGGQSDATVSRDELLGWQAHAGGSFTLELFAGDHFFTQGEERALLAYLSKRLA